MQPGVAEHSSAAGEDKHSGAAGEEKRSGTAELLLLHKLGSSHASPAFSPTANPTDKVLGDGAEALPALTPGALPEGSAELLLLKKARHSC